VLALKTEFALKIFTVLNILFTFRIFVQLALALKDRVCPEFTVLNVYFLIFRILNNLRVCSEFFKPGGGCRAPPASYATGYS